jgi:glycine hydroxymethyltransferase
MIDRGFDIVSGGTDNHLMLVDLRNKNVNGKETEKALFLQILLVTKIWFLLMINHHSPHQVSD